MVHGFFNFFFFCLPYSKFLLRLFASGKQSIFLVKNKRVGDRSTRERLDRHTCLVAAHISILDLDRCTTWPSFSDSQPPPSHSTSVISRPFIVVHGEEQGRRPPPSVVTGRTVSP
uniref:Secreted protein n=1 Tax=Sipha flava TaxID=143950 RepID=A0A2S2QC19_9HEMI